MLSEKEIQFLFTLRYNPLRKPPIQRRDGLDFITTTDESDAEFRLKQSLKDLTGGLSRVAISYSAGVDSNVVLACLREIRPDIRIELYTTNGKEEKLTRELHEKYKLATSLKVIPTESVLLNIQKYVKMTGEPRWNVYHHVIAETAKSDGHSLLLTGDGADELFGGYVFRYKQFTQAYKTKSFQSAYMDGHRNDWLILQDFFLKNFKWSTISDYLGRFKSSFLSPLESIMYADFNGKLLYDFIPTSQAIQRWHGIKIASPFLDKTLIDHALRLDTNQKVSDDFSIGKIPLRNILLSKNIEVSNEKMGFTYDLINDWNNKKHRTLYMHPKTFDVIDYRWWERNNAEESDYRTINKIYQTICLSEYYKLLERES